MTLLGPQCGGERERAGAIRKLLDAVHLILSGSGLLADADLQGGLVGLEDLDLQGGLVGLEDLA